MIFSDKDLQFIKVRKGCRAELWLSGDGLSIELSALIARLETDESLLDRAIERMKLINGPESDCVIQEWTDCENHRWIREAEAHRAAGKDGR